VCAHTQEYTERERERQMQISFKIHINICLHAHTNIFKHSIKHFLPQESRVVFQNKSSLLLRIIFTTTYKYLNYIKTEINHKSYQFNQAGRLSWINHKSN
jgi:hypothetical protein